MHFRAATLADISVLRGLAQKIWRACYPSIISTDQIEFMLEWMYSEKQIRDEIQTGIAWDIIENDGGRAIGFLSFQLDPDGRVKLNKLYVVPELQRQGIGRLALARVMTRARELGARSVWMQVNKGNAAAIAAYRKAGFAIAQEAVFEIGGGFVMDDYLMEKAVDPHAPAK